MIPRFLTSTRTNLSTVFQASWAVWTTFWKEPFAARMITLISTPNFFAFPITRVFGRARSSIKWRTSRNFSRTLPLTFWNQSLSKLFRPNGLPSLPARCLSRTSNTLLADCSDGAFTVYDPDDTCFKSVQNVTSRRRLPIGYFWYVHGPGLPLAT